MAKCRICQQSLANIYLQKKDYAQAEDWYKKVIAADPKNKEAYYTLGVIAWSQFVPSWREARSTRASGRKIRGRSRIPNPPRRIRRLLQPLSLILKPI